MTKRQSIRKNKIVRIKKAKIKHNRIKNNKLNQKNRIKNNYRNLKNLFSSSILMRSLRMNRLLIILMISQVLLKMRMISFRKSVLGEL